MAASEALELTLRRAARRAYESERLRSALWLSAAFAMLALPGFLMCKATPLAFLCLPGRRPPGSWRLVLPAPRPPRNSGLSLSKVARCGSPIIAEERCC
jgi:hypothetical protein